MTYEEYKNSSKQNNKKRNWLKNVISKFFTVVIFTMIILIISNFSPKFREFLIDDVLNHTMDFSKLNNIIDSFTEVFKIDNTKPVIKNENEKVEVYKDGKKIYMTSSDQVLIKDSGIVTFIGEKEGYGNTIIIQQSNGYYAWYGNIKESVKLYDYVESGNALGSTSEYYYYVLYKDDKPITNEN